MLPSQIEALPAVAAIYAATIYAAMLLYANILARFRFISTHITPFTGRYGSLDGLRGLLAAGVLIHHSFAAYIYFTTGQWIWSNSPLLNQLGQTTVAMFFMLTSFLFTLKANKRAIDWRALYVARITRLLPLYGIIVCVVFAVAFAATGYALREPAWKVLTEFARWLILGRPDINGLKKTWTLIAGVSWSLKFEVAFYAFAIPTLHILSRYIPNRGMVLLTTLTLAAVLATWIYQDSNHWTALYIAHFLCGTLAAYIYQEPSLKSIITSTPYKLIGGLSIFVLLFFSSAHNCTSVLITLCFFCAVLGGMSMRGLLNTKAARWLGDISYGIYLTHGLVLWLTLSALKYNNRLSEMNLLTYGGVVIGVAAIAVVLASLSYRFIEKPSMHLSQKWMNKAPNNNAFNSSHVDTNTRKVAPDQIRETCTEKICDNHNNQTRA